LRKLVVDIETNALYNPSIIWCICAVDVDTNEWFSFSEKEVYSNECKKLLAEAGTLIGHNFGTYDLPCINSLLGLVIPHSRVLDTLVLSQLFKYSIEGGHSLEAWGARLGSEKVGLDVDFSQYSTELVARCKRDVEINLKLYRLLKSKILDNPHFEKAVKVEHDMQAICMDMSQNGFKFDINTAQQFREELTTKLNELDGKIKQAFPPKTKLIREVTPKLTKYGTISRQGLPRGWDDFDSITAGCPFSLFTWEEFNPGSPSQVCERLHQAGWKPTEKTTGHLEAKGSKAEIAEKYGITGWKVNEKNLSTLPEDAPEGARHLVERLLVSGRWRTLNEWISYVDPCDECIHPRFNGIGTWTHRMSHQAPNLGNVAAAKSIKYKGPALEKLAIEYGSRMRALWTTSNPDWWLVGTDAVGIQLRIFAHYINDPEFIKAVCEGNSKDGSDPHSLNARVLGVPRDVAKTFIYAFLLGAGDAKIGEIVGGSKRDGRDAKQKYVEAYPGLKLLRETQIPRDAARGFFQSFDGRLVVCDSEHLMMAGYLQTGEACIMKHANVLWRKKANELKIPYRQVNFVHDEWQTEVCSPEKGQAESLGRIQCDAIRVVGEMFKLNCPMAGDTRVGKNWLETH
jgi:DNA polymerase-1